MDANTEKDPAERHVQAVQERIDVERELVGETLEALSYKTDIKARGSEAIASGVETAKSVASQAVEQATVHAIDLAGRASEAVAAGVGATQQTTNDALDIARASTRDVDPRLLRRIGLTSLAGTLVLAVIGLVRRSRRS